MPVSRTSSPELILELDRSSRRRLAAQLERTLRAAVREGRLAPGTALPSTRALAQELGVSRGVVVAAYGQLGAEGYLTVRQGAQVRVAGAGAAPEPEDEPGPPPAPRYNLRPDMADYGSFPRRAWLAALRTVLAGATDEELGYGDSRGPLAPRAALASYLGRVRGVAARAGRVFVTVGFAHGLTAVCGVLRERGATRIALEDPGHPFVRRIVEQTGLELVHVPVDADGLVVEAVLAADPDVVLATPAHHFPTTAVLSRERRAALVDWAAARDAVVLEDDVDAEFRYDRAPVGALQGLAPERVVYLGSTSRTLAPALRLGWAVVPSWLAPALAGHVAATIIAPPAIDQLALGHFVEGGELDRHLRRMRLRYRRRRDALVAALARAVPEIEVSGVAAGLHVQARLPDGFDEAAVLAAARARRIALGGMSEYGIVPRSVPPTLLLGFARSGEAALRAAVRELALAIGDATARPRSGSVDTG
jgi:GntR family transcriptional regulator / MocR family aminotransferase